MRNYYMYEGTCVLHVYTANQRTVMHIYAYIYIS